MPRYKRSRLSEQLLETIPYDWIDAEDVIQKFIPQIAPGIALRYYNEGYEKWRSKIEDPQGPTNKLEGDAAIRSGARAIVREAMNRVQDGGYIESEGRGKKRRIRRIERLMFDGAYCCLHGGNCGARTTAAIQQQKQDEYIFSYPRFQEGD